MLKADITFTRTAQAAGKDRQSRWELIEAIAIDATDNGVPITSLASIIAAKSALEQAGAEYADMTIKHLCLVAKFDHESTPRQRKEWRRYGWTAIGRVVNAGLSQEAAYSLLSGDRKTVAEIQDMLRSNVTPERRRTEPPFDLRCARWVQHMNALMMEGAGLVAESEQTEGIVIGGHAALALSIYRRLAERQLDAETPPVHSTPDRREVTGAYKGRPGFERDDRNNLSIYQRAEEALEYLIECSGHTELSKREFAGVMAARHGRPWLLKNGNPNRALVEQVMNATRDQDVDPLAREMFGGLVVAYAPNTGGLTLVDPNGEMALPHQLHMLAGDVSIQQKAKTTLRRRLPTWKAAAFAAMSAGDFDLGRLLSQIENEIDTNGVASDTLIARYLTEMAARKIQGGEGDVP